MGIVISTPDDPDKSIFENVAMELLMEEKIL